MSTPFVVKGWCPGVHRPMLSGDGLIVRVRPRQSAISARQAAGLARAAIRHGNGRLDLTSRANLQVRGVRPQTFRPLLEELAALDLLDEDETAESRRNVVVTPFRSDVRAGEIEAVACALEGAATGLDGLPGKFGFAIDTGPRRVLAGTPADIRLERSRSGGLIVRPDGWPGGRTVAPAEAVPAMIGLARWFVASQGAAEGRGRMARHLAAGAVLPEPGAWAEPPVDIEPEPAPGLTAEGCLIAVAFGALDARALLALAELGSDLRITPWRMLLAVGLETVPAIEGLVTRPDDPLLRVTACAGAPDCTQAIAPTRALAARLAAVVPPGQHLHVSGCAKGCARAEPATVTLTATANGFDLVRDGRAGDPPVRRGLAEAALCSRFDLLIEAP